jgi:hypothetical protein
MTNVQPLERSTENALPAPDEVADEVCEGSYIFILLVVTVKAVLRFHSAHPYLM